MDREKRSARLEEGTTKRLRGAMIKITVRNRRRQRFINNNNWPKSDVTRAVGVKIRDRKDENKITKIQCALPELSLCVYIKPITLVRVLVYLQF